MRMFSSSGGRDKSWRNQRDCCRGAQLNEPQPERKQEKYDSKTEINKMRKMQSDLAPSLWGLKIGCLTGIT